MFDTGQIVATDLVWTEGMEKWRRADMVFGTPVVHNPYAATATNPRVSAVAELEEWQYGGFWWLVTSYQGRIPRSKYWFGMVVLCGVMIAATAAWVGFSVGATKAMGASEDATILVMLGGFALLFVVWHYFLFAVMAKRWHDRGKTGWMCLVRFLPQIGGLWILIECGCMRGTMGANHYGPDPLLGESL